MAPDRPKSLADPAVLAARRATLDAPHLAPLRALARTIAAERGAPVPDPDPLDAGVRARLLVLLETPGPTIGRTGLVSRDNPAGTAANLFRFLAAANLPRAETLIWNAVPWVIHAPGARNRAPRRAEWRAARPYLARLLVLLPDLAAIVLAGRVAGEAEAPLRDLGWAGPIVRVPHPSPTYVCTAPAVSARILVGLHAAAGHLGRAGPPSPPSGTPA